MMEWKGKTFIILHYSKIFLETLGNITKSLRMLGIWVENQIRDLSNWTGGRNVDHSDWMCGRLTYEVLQVVVRVAAILSKSLCMSCRRIGKQRHRSSQFNLGT
jgi:hypothetical protein